MMIRSSSTPVLGSLLSPENPNNHLLHDNITLHPYKSSPIHKFSFHQHFTTLSCNSSPVSPSFGNNVGIRRVQSEGNLESLMNSGGNEDHDSSFFFNPPKKVSHKSILETIPSLSYHNSRFKSDDDEYDEDDNEEQDEGFCGFSNIQNNVLNLSMNKQIGYGNLEMKNDVGETGGYQMYLAKGLGVDAGFGCADGGAAGSGGGGRSLSHGGEAAGGGGDSHDVEEHYRKMVNECPGNPLLLGNYAQFLYQSKQDLQGAEEYYSRAILADPNDGEILSQYAQLLWELHHDRERSTAYFERAIQAASEDSHVHAAYASFLWETEVEEDEEEEEGGYYSTNTSTSIFNNGKMASAAAS